MIVALTLLKNNKNPSYDGFSLNTFKIKNLSLQRTTAITDINSPRTARNGGLTWGRVGGLGVVAYRLWGGLSVGGSRGDGLGDIIAH